MKFHLKKIISGAQTGVDIGTAEAAMSEKDRSDLAVGIPQSRRTECNVRDSDGSLVIGRTGYPYGPGTATTVKLANRYGKPVFKLWLPEDDATLEVVKWIHTHHIHTLNVAGPSETETPGIQQLTYDFVIGFWQQLVKLQTE